MKRKNYKEASVWERITARFKNKEPENEEPEIYIPTEEELKEMEERRLTNYYGVDTKGRVTMAYTVFDMQSIGWKVDENPTCRYTLVGIDNYHEKFSMLDLIAKFHGTGKSEWEYFMAYHIVLGLRKAWANGKKTVDLTNLMNMEMWAHKPEGYEGKTKVINEKEYRVLEKEDIRERVLSFATIVEETPEKVKFRFNV